LSDADVRVEADSGVVMGSSVLFILIACDVRGTFREFCEPNYDAPSSILPWPFYQISRQGELKPCPKSARSLGRWLNGAVEIGSRCREGVRQALGRDRAGLPRLRSVNDVWMGDNQLSHDAKTSRLVTLS